MLGLMKLMSRDKVAPKTTKDDDGGDAGDKSRLLLHVTETGWTRRVVNPKDPENPQIDTFDCSHLLESEKGDRRKVYEGVFRNIGERIKGKDVQAYADVDILIDDPDILYCDTKAELFRSSSTQLMHDFGQNQLHCNSVVYGMAPFGSTRDSQRKGGVAAFMDAGRIGSYLTRLDRLAVQVRSITPVADILARRATGAGRPYGALYVGASATQILMANALPSFGAVVVRALPFGSWVLTKLMADENGLSMEEAARILKEQDQLSELKILGSDASMVETMTRSNIDRILGMPVRTFFESVAQTCEYFEAQRVSGLPETLEVFGDVASLNGFDKLLQRQLIPPGEAAIDTVFDVFCKTPRTERLNLLEGANAELRIGKTKFSFKNERLEEVPLSGAGSSVSIGPETGKPMSTRERRKAMRERKRSKSQPDRGHGSLASLNKMFSGLLKGANSGAGSAAPASGTELSSRDEQMGFALVAIVILGTLYWGYTQVSDMDDRYQRQTRTFDRTVGTSMQRASDLGAVDVVRPVGGPQQVDKVLWTEKFLALASHLTEYMYLTDVFLDTDTRTIADVTSESKKLVMKGVVRPSSSGHILEISKFIQDLENDSSYFMSDFHDVSFTGAALEGTPDQGVIRFGVEARYDATIRTRSLDAGAGNQGGAVGGVGRMQNTVRDRNQQIDATLPGGSR